MGRDKNFFTGGATNIWGIVNNLTGKVTSGFNFEAKAVDVALKMMIKMQTIFGDIVAGAKALPGKWVKVSSQWLKELGRASSILAIQC